jgi:hypothetical protein
MLSTEAEYARNAIGRELTPLGTGSHCLASLFGIWRRSGWLGIGLRLRGIGFALMLWRFRIPRRYYVVMVPMVFFMFHGTILTHFPGIVFDSCSGFPLAGMANPMLAAMMFARSPRVTWPFGFHEVWLPTGVPTMMPEFCNAVMAGQ